MTKDHGQAVPEAQPGIDGIRGRTRLPVDPTSFRVTGPFRMVGAIERAYFLGDGDTESEFGSDRHPQGDVLSAIDGIQIYCTSNRCRSGATRYRRPPTLVGVLTATTADHFISVGLVAPRREGRTSRKRRPLGTSTLWHDLPADFSCERCGMEGSATMMV